MSFGVLLRRWRAVRHLSQLDLALDAEISTRHLSCVETGRAQPSREMVLVWQEALQVPFRERNTLLLVAGLGGYYYSAAKAASIHVARCAAMELGEKGIRVNSLSPAMIATELSPSTWVWSPS